MAITVSFYDNFILDVGAGRINLNSDTFKVALVNGYTFNSAHEDFGDITNKVSDGFGYDAVGADLTGTTWLFASGATKLDADDHVWSATGGDIGPFTGAVIYSDTSTDPSDDRLVLYIDFGGTFTANDGGELKITFDIEGLLTIQ